MFQVYKNFFSGKWRPGDPSRRVNLAPARGAQVLQLIVVRPTRYDDDGYPIHWYRSYIPSNSLAVLNGIALDSANRQALGPDVEIRVTAFDEACDLLDYPYLIQRLKQAGHRALLCLAGVQSNQFPRSIDIARHFREAGLPVVLGGFHVSGCVSMLEELPPELVDAQRQGISLFAGEAELGRFDRVLEDAWHDKLEALYNYQTELVPLNEQALPKLPLEVVERNMSTMGSIDLGRGCPYTCSFCCIINVQGQKSRSRSADDFERFIRHSVAQGVTSIFLTDDNFARNKDWEQYFDRAIALRDEGIRLRLIIQVDTLCHKIHGFIDKAARAGVDQVFVGLENINPDNLLAMKKRQNKITEYREMLLQWKRHPVVIWGAYIIGLPNDTRESVLRDVEIIKRELPIDLFNCSILTPLPGSEDHRRMLKEGTWMDPDLNQYDLAHRVIHHQKMSDAELDQTYQDAWDTYYTYDHMKTVLRRARALGSNKKFLTTERLLGFGVITRVNKLRSYDMGLVRNKPRKSRRPGMPLEPALLFHPKNIFRNLYGTLVTVYWSTRLVSFMKKLWKSPEALEYRDLAITPPQREDLDELGLYQETRGGVQVVEKVKHREKARAVRAAG